MSFPSVSDGTTPAGGNNSPYLHPLHIVKETHKALVDTDFTTGRKLINQYEIIDELGRGMHGKVKLARDLTSDGMYVAIKIIPRFSKKRRLGKVTAMSTQDKSKKEIAILKKIRHPNVVALLEVIDDPELKKIYMVLEHVELGEIVWRKKGVPHICSYERRRVEREMRGDMPTPEEEKYELTLERRQAVKDAKRARMSQIQSVNAEYWSLEYGPATDDDDAGSQARSPDLVSRSIPSNSEFLTGSRATSRAPSRTQSYRSVSRAGTPHPSEPEPSPIPNEEDLETPGPLCSNPGSSTALDGSMYGLYDEVPPLRGRSPSMPDSIISHMSSVDYNRPIDPYADDYSYVPCFTFEQARSSFRDTVLGVEYLHYEGVVHRDIKPANLLWTRDHRVKISDFGVSYFGRPIRYGEPDDTMSESEARDFDNDFELSKTVGTPAFFAPELCYTDALDEQPGQLQPKVTEQIDVWSLGVTLYCLIFARIPFLAEDEWQMFRKIATEEVYIPTKRLRPVDPSTKPDERSLYASNAGAAYRNDDELAYEDVEPELQDLLRRMLTKQPDKRIKLRDVKRHSWVTKGLPNVIAWLDDTEPARRTSGRKIQVDEREMAYAVVPLTFLERAKSAVKKTLGKVMHPRGDRGESSSRRRATSSAASSAGDSPSNGPPTPYPRENRRRSLRGDLRGDDYFAALKGHQPSGEHPLTYSVTASPYESPVDGDGSASNLQQAMIRHGPEGHTRPVSTEPLADKQTGQARLGTQKPLPPLPRHAHARSVTNAFLAFTPPIFHESRTVPPTPCFDSPLSSHEDPSNTLRKARDMRPNADDTSRARSVDRGLFASNDKRAEAKISLSTAVAPGAVQIPPPRPRSMRPADLSKRPDATPLPSPLHLPPSVPQALTGYRHGQPKSESNMHDDQRAFMDFNERPTTAHRMEDVPEAQTPPPRVYNNASTPESFARAQQQMVRRQLLDIEDEINRQKLLEAEAEFDPSMIPCPPSPDDDTFSRRPCPLSREETVGTAFSSNSASMGNLTTPLTSPSEMASPVCIANPTPLKDHNTQQILAFQSDPSLPALLSSTSSVSADPEGDFLGNPGVVPRASLIDTTDSLTPPALIKEPIAEFPLEVHEQMMDGAVAVRPDDRVDQPHLAVDLSADATALPRAMDEDDEESDSDEGLTMAKSRKKRLSKESSPASMGKVVMGAKRRDTNCSIGSTDTAKKLVIQTD